MTPHALLSPFGGWASFGSAVAILGAIARVALIPLVVTPIFDQVLGAGNLDRLGEVLWVAGSVALAGAALIYLQDLSFGLAARTRGAAVRRQLHALMLRQRQFGERQSSAGLSARIVHDLREVEQYLQWTVGGLIAESAVMVLILAVLAVTAPGVTLILLLLSLPAVLAMRLLGRLVERSSHQHQAQVEGVAARLQEHLKYRELLRSFGAFEFAARRFEASNRLATQAMGRRVHVGAIPTPVLQGITVLAMGALLVLLTRSVFSGALSVGEMVSYITLVALLTAPAQMLPRILTNYRQARSAAVRLSELLVDREPAAPERPAAAARASLASRQLVIDRPDGLALPIPDLRVDAPMLIALVGPSGIGKTTLLRTLLGMRPPRSGELTIAGVDIDPAGVGDEAALRNRVAYVPQDAALLSGSYRENLTLGRPFDDRALLRALEEVGLGPLIAQRRIGLDTELAEDGLGLSGGERQRFAIARALLGNPSVLLLDEPTSALEAEREEALLTLIAELARERVVVVVSHRQAILRFADAVLVLDEEGARLDTAARLETEARLDSPERSER